MKSRVKLPSAFLKALASDKFFYFVVSLCILQGLWYAFSFRPSIFDEGIHIGFIKEYATRLSPFINEQPTSLDFLGEVTRNGSYLYYYLLSWPLKIINFFTGSDMARIISLRVINIALFAIGLLLFKKAFTEAGLSKVVSNMSLLFLILTPSLALLPGSVNYDNAIFLLTGLILFTAIKVVRSKVISFLHLSLILILGLLGALIKFQFIVIFVPIILFVCYDLWRKHREEVFIKLLDSFRKLTLPIKVASITSLIIASSLFIERPVVNLIEYQNVSPGCTQIISEDRCLKNYTAQRDITALEAKPADFSPMNPFNYILQEWIPGMITTQTITPPTQLSSALLRVFYYATALFGIALLLVYLRDFLKNRSFKLMLFIAVFYTAILAFYNYQSYMSIGQPVAITGRYLLPVLPILAIFIIESTAKLLRHNRYLLTVGVLAALLIFTQGGGMLTHLISANSNMYWPRSPLHKANQYIKDRLDNFVILKDVK